MYACCLFSFRVIRVGEYSKYPPIGVLFTNRSISCILIPNRSIAVRETCRVLYCSRKFCTFTHKVLIDTMQQGTIARLTDKGFGFIAVEGQEKDIFFHANELVDIQFDELREGDTVTFEVVDGPKGPAASGVKKV